MDGGRRLIFEWWGDRRALHARGTWHSQSQNIVAELHRIACAQQFLIDAAAIEPRAVSTAQIVNPPTAVRTANELGVHARYAVSGQHELRFWAPADDVMTARHRDHPGVIIDRVV